MKHDPMTCMHNEMEELPNLHVMMMMMMVVVVMIMMMKTCKHNRIEKFNWQRHYLFTTTEGMITLV